MYNQTDFLVNYDLLENRLKITSGGYEDFSYFTEIFEPKGFISKCSPYYCECIILPDGRVLDATPSHSIAMDSLLNFLKPRDEYSSWKLSPTWLVEERLYYTGAVMVWKEQQIGFGKLTEYQKGTLKLLENSKKIHFNYCNYDKEKQDFFISNKDEIHHQAIEWYTKNT